MFSLIRLHLVWLLLVLNGAFLNAQILQETGELYTRVASNISGMPSNSGDNYSEPPTSQLATWEATLSALLAGNYTEASDSANVIGYNLIAFTDTLTVPFVEYYLLETIDSNYWGTYVYNPNYCRPLIIQAPHAKKDAKTGNQGIHVFRETESLFYQVNGTHRCNSSAFSACTGTTSGCSSSSTSEPYRISDLAHVTQSLFQKTTQVLYDAFDSTYFIQLHGFAKLSTDPYLILSNGTDQTPSPDYLPAFRDHLYNEDTVLTFKIAHIDTNWTRLRGFWNAQGRLINSSPDPCTTNATTTNGRFFHVEQEKIRLRNDENGWNKIANALKNTFACSYLSNDVLPPTSGIFVSPNPTTNCIYVRCEYGNQLPYHLLDLHGHVVMEGILIESNAQKIDIGHLKPGCYFLRVQSFTERIIKQ